MTRQMPKNFCLPPRLSPKGELHSPFINSFDMLTPETRYALEYISIRREWNNGKVIHQAGDVIDSALMVTTGRVRVTATSRDGNELVRRWLSINEIVGLCSAVSALPFPLSIVAFDNCKTVHFPSSALLQVMQSSSTVATEMGIFLARRVHELIDLTIDHAHEQLHEKVYATLLRLSEIKGARTTPDGIELRISQYELACMVGSSRQHMNVTLKTMQDQGIIRLGYRSVVLLKQHSGHG